jgi:hypothetical protein
VYDPRPCSRQQGHPRDDRIAPAGKSLAAAVREGRLVRPIVATFQPAQEEFSRAILAGKGEFPRRKSE